MKANGGLTRENSERFRKYILSVGNSVDLNKAFKELVTIWKSNPFKKRWTLEN
jgi:Zn-dependent oligopeptidase